MGLKTLLPCMDSDIRASYGPSPWVQQHDCTLNGVRITKTSLREGDKHVWCLFPDGRVMVVREEKIRVTKRSRYTTQGVIDVQLAA